MKEESFYKTEYAALALFSIFPLLPNKLKGIPVIFLFLVSIFLFIKKRKYKYPYKKVLFFSSLYLIYLVSLMYTEHLDHVDKLLSTRLSLLVIPISFGFISTIRRSIELQPMIRLFKIIVVITAVYAFLILFYLYQLGVFTGIMSLDAAQSYVTNRMWGINQHAIYASMFIGIAIILAIVILQKDKERKTITIMTLSLLVLISTLLILSRKGVLIALFFVVVLFFILQRDRIEIKKYLFIMTVTLATLFLTSSYIRGRFSELFKSSTYASIKEDNSTSIRYGIYTCVLEEAKEAPLLMGYGIGDVRYELNECYKRKFNALYKMNYNSHNQYLSYYLSCGIFGLILLILIMTKSIRKGITDKNLFLLLLSLFFGIIMLFENILERQSGVILFSFYLGLLNFIDFKRVTINNEN